MDSSFILASLSPRRRELLEALGLSFTVIPSGIEENHQNDETPREHVLRLAHEKAVFVAGRHPEAWVLGADTIVVIDGEILGKPDHGPEAREMLQRLSGREHTVITGFSLVHSGRGVVYADAVESVVVFRELDNDEIEWYIAGDEPYDKAGGYAVQGKAGCFVSEIRGSGTNVIGLPLAEVVTALKQYAVIQLRVENESGHVVNS